MYFLIQCTKHYNHKGGGREDISVLFTVSFSIISLLRCMFNRKRQSLVGVGGPPPPLPQHNKNRKWFCVIGNISFKYNLFNYFFVVVVVFLINSLKKNIKIRKTLFLFITDFLFFYLFIYFCKTLNCL